MVIPTRTLHIPKQVPMEIDRYALESFQSDALTAINKHEAMLQLMQGQIYALEGQIAIAGKVLTWMQQHRPEALQDYETTKQVTERLENSNNGETMTEKMV